MGTSAPRYDGRRHEAASSVALQTYRSEAEVEVIQESSPTARRRHRLMHWPAGLGWLAVASGLAVVIAILVAQGRTKTWFALIALSAAFILAHLERATRFKVLVLAVLTAPLLFGAGVPIPLELTLSQSLLIFVVAAEMLATFSSGRAATTVLGARRPLLRAVRPVRPAGPGLDVHQRGVVRLLARGLSRAALVALRGRSAVARRGECHGADQGRCGSHPRVRRHRLGRPSDGPCGAGAAF